MAGSLHNRECREKMSRNSQPPKKVVPMSVEPSKRISEIPLIRREETSTPSQRKKPKQKKKEEKDEHQKVDIRV